MIDETEVKDYIRIMLMLINDYVIPNFYSKLRCDAWLITEIINSGRIGKIRTRSGGIAI